MQLQKFGQMTRARSLRSQSTDAERKLWRRLRNRQLEGLKFRRQHPMGRYVADFCCLEIGLIIELDGSQHAERTEQDAKRTEFLEAQGFRVLRFWNPDVLRETDVVVDTIRAAIASKPPHPALSPPAGRGE